MQKTMFGEFDEQQLTRTAKRPINYQETSREAFDSFQPESGTLDAQILAVLLEAGKDGLIDQEIEIRLGRSHQAVSGNRRHLVERKLVCETRLRGQTSSGRRAIKWVHCNFFDAALHSDADC
jgi:hypothetical protein